MKTLQKSVLIGYSPQQMFDVVTNVAAYSSFLPWCHDSKVLAQTKAGMTAQVGLSLAGFKQSFTTRNTHVQGLDGSLQVLMDLQDGPFSHLAGGWRFDPIVGSDSPACRVSLDLSYHIKNPMLAMAMGAAFEKIAKQMVTAFVERARQIYA